MNLPESLKTLVITLSDRASRGDYSDLSGHLIKEKLSGFFKSSGWKGKTDMVLLPDNPEMLRAELIKAGSEYNIIITTGGTGIGPNDITVETVKPLLSKEIPGIMEYIRIRYGTENPNALLSRGVAGLLGNALIYTVPGSVRAAEEYMTEILKTLGHAIQMQYGIDMHGKYQ